MPTPTRDRSSIYASRLFSRRALDQRARLIARFATGERVVVHARTCDISHSGAGLTLTRELPAGTEVTLWLRLPGNGNLCLQAVIARRAGFHAGIRFVETSAEQRLLLAELCSA